MPTTLDEVRAKLEDKDINKTFEFNSSDSNVKLLNEENDYYLKNGKKNYQVAEIAFPSLLNNLNLPLSLKNKIGHHPELLKHNINYILNNSNLGIRALCRGKSIIGFSKPNHTIISHNQVLNSLEKSLGKDVFIDKYNVQENGKLDINITNDSIKNRLKLAKDDYFQSGVHVSNSPYGAEPILIEGYLLRLACTNGAIASDAVYKSPNTISDDTNSWLMSNIKNAASSTLGLFKGLKRLKKNKISGDSALFLSNLFEELDIPVSVQNKILHKASEEGMDNMYDIFNHFTYIASHDKDVRVDPDMRNKLMRISSHYVSHIQDMCNSCNRPRMVIN